ncbi:hypothetical protein UlMin_023112 [Ulmus minor]
MASARSNKINHTHQMYREGRYEEALGFYTEALVMAKTKLQKTVLHSNRVACYFLFEASRFQKAEECTSMLDLNQNHTRALMLQAQTLMTLKEYHSMLFDVNRLIELNPSSEVYQNLEAPLRTQLSLAPIPELEAEFEEEEEEEYKDEEIYEEKESGSNVASKATVQSVDLSSSTTTDADVISPKPPTKKAVSEQGKDLKVNSLKNTPLAEVIAPQAKPINRLLEKDPKGCQAIPKPKGYSTLDYGRWNRVEDDDDDDDDEEDQPQDRFRVKTVGVRPVK